MNRKTARKTAAADARANAARAIRTTAWGERLKPYAFKDLDPVRVLAGLRAAGPAAEAYDPATEADLRAAERAAWAELKAAEEAIAPPETYAETMAALQELWPYPGGVGPKTADKMRAVKGASAAWSRAYSALAEYRGREHAAFWRAYQTA